MKKTITLLFALASLIFTINAQINLNVEGDAKISGLSGIGLRMVVVDADGNLSTQAIPSGGGHWLLLNNHIFNTNTGNVGIGTATPLSKLDIIGTFRASSLSGTGIHMVVADANGQLSTQTIPSGDSDTDQQILTLSGDSLKLSAGISGGGGIVDLSTYLDNTDSQSLSFDTATALLSINNGTGVDLSSLAGGSSGAGGDNISDADNDTKIQVEESPDEDKIRFDLAGTEHFVMDGPRLEVLNSGQSVLIGQGAGANDDLNNNQNIAIGDSALSLNASGDHNVAIGVAALHNNAERSNLIAIGDSALYHNSVGATKSGDAINNLAIGSKALFSNTEGRDNTATGNEALYSNTTGDDNTATGREALHSNTIGSENTATGNEALYSNTIGGYNTANGDEALYSNTTGNFNTATGMEALHSNTTGSGNTATGSVALNFNTTGSSNTASGIQSLFFNTTGNYNTAYGTQALFSNTNGYSNVAIGMRALFHNTDRSNLVAIGDSALFNNGLNASSSSDGRSNTAIGSKVLYSNTIGSNNTAMGRTALRENTTGSNNTAIGRAALHDNTSGFNNTATGILALTSNITGTRNTAMGAFALFANTTGFHNTANGHSANSVGSTLNNSTGLGHNADCSASNQVRIGDDNVTSIGGHANWTNVSDMRFKKQVREQTVPGLNFINLLRPVTYNMDLYAIEDWWAENYNERDTFNYPGKYDKECIRYTGFIAQEVEAAAQSIGYDFSGVDAPKNDKDFYGLRYATFVVPLVQAVQEVSAQLAVDSAQLEELRIYNKQLTMSNEQLKSKVESLEKRLAKIEQMLDVQSAEK